MLKQTFATLYRMAYSPTAQLIGLFLVASVAEAANTGSTMPWDTGFGVLTSNLTGRTAYGLALVGGAGTAWGMLSHGQMDEVMRRGSHWMLAGGALLAVPTIARTMGVTGALV